MMINVYAKDFHQFTYLHLKIWIQKTVIIYKVLLGRSQVFHLIVGAENGKQ